MINIVCNFLLTLVWSFVFVFSGISTWVYINLTVDGLMKYKGLK